MGLGGDATGLLAREWQRRQSGHRVLERLSLLDRWARFGEPALVGAMALELVVRPDIDLEVHTPAPRIEDGFAVVVECARLPGVRRVRFRNELVDSDPMLPVGLFWRLEYLAEEAVWWTIDMWELPVGAHEDARSGVWLASRLRPRLDVERRVTILAIKEAAVAAGSHIPGMAVYRAVIEAGATTLQDAQRWYEGYAKGLSSPARGPE